MALVLAKAAKAPPRKVAEAMVAHLELPDWVAGVEVAGPGFVNVRLDQSWFAGLVRRVVAAGESFGTIDLGHGERVNVEFISANPTGPLHVGNARLAPMGDALANLLTATGHKVEREYYFNDAGNQIEQLGASVEAAYLQLLGRPAEVPADGYKGAYVADVATRAPRPSRARPWPTSTRPSAGPASPTGPSAACWPGSGRPWPGSGSSSTSGSPSAPCTTPGPSPRPSTSCAPGAWSRSATGRCGCAPPSSATTRTAR